MNVSTPGRERIGSTRSGRKKTTYKVGVFGRVLQAVDGEVHAVIVRGDAYTVATNLARDVLHMIGDMSDVGARIGADEGREEDGLDDAVLLARSVADQGKDVVGHVSRMIPQGTRAGVGPDEGRLGQSYRLPHGLDGCVRKIDHNPLAVEFLDELFPQLGQCIPLVSLGDGRPGPRR